MMVDRDLVEPQADLLKVTNALAVAMNEQLGGQDREHYRMLDYRCGYPVRLCVDVMAGADNARADVLAGMCRALGLRLTVVPAREA